jgi:hypothetical protein
MNKHLLIEKHFIGRNTIFGLFREFFAVDSHGPDTPWQVHTSFAQHSTFE